MTVLRPTRADLWWLFGACALVFGFFAVPPWGVGTGFDERAAREFPRYLLADSATPTPGLQALVDDWSRYHAVKLVFAGLLALMAVQLGHRLLALAPTVLVLANVQGTVAPLSSALSLLDPHDRFLAPDLARGLYRMRMDLTGSRSAPIDELTRDFAWYHAVLAGMAIALAVVLVVAAVRAWRRGRRWWCAATVVAVVACGVLTAANVSTALDPVRGLLDFLGGS